MIRLEISARGLVGIAAVVAGIWLVAQLWPVLLLLTVSLMFAAALSSGWSGTGPAAPWPCSSSWCSWSWPPR